MRRSFKAATVFTGAAALAGGYAPTALATTAQATGVETTRVCGANNGGVSNWVHFYYPNNDHSAECFGGKISTVANATIYSFCPGNNNGEISGYAPARKNSPYLWHFHANSGRANVGVYANNASPEFHVEFIAIYSWSGHAKCT